MKLKNAVVGLFMLFACNIFAKNIEFIGSWNAYKYEEINHVTGEIKWDYIENYTFLDNTWVKISGDTYRHELKYEIKNEYLNIYDRKFAIISGNSKEIILLEVFDYVGDLYIGKHDLIVLRKIDKQ